MAHPKILDGDLVLVDAGTTINATAYSDPLNVPMAASNRWNQANDRGGHHMDLVVDISAHDGEATVEIVAQIDTNSDFTSGSVTTVKVPISENATGRFVIPLSHALAGKQLSAADYIRCGITISGGSSPTLTYGAFLSKC